MTKETLIKQLEALESKYKDGRDLLTWDIFNQAFDLLDGTDIDLYEEINNCDFDDKAGFIGTQEICMEGADKDYMETLENRIEDAKALNCDFVGFDLYNTVVPVYTWLYSVAINGAVYDLKKLA